MKRREASSTQEYHTSLGVRWISSIRGFEIGSQLAEISMSPLRLEAPSPGRLHLLLLLLLLLLPSQALT